MIDLHSHTYASDGTCSPAELIQEALRAGIQTLGITNHDTFASYDAAVPLAREAGSSTTLSLVRYGRHVGRLFTAKSPS